MKKTFVFMIAFVVILTGCADTKKHSKGVYMLLDTSGTYALELKKAQLILNYLLATLQPMDTLAVARIDTENFSEKDIIAKVTFYQRPSVANNQKRAFQKKIDKFTSKVKSSKYTDISGGLYQAIEYLNKADPGKKYILIFSDLKEELKKGDVKDVPFQLAGFNVIAKAATVNGVWSTTWSGSITFFQNNCRHPARIPNETFIYRCFSLSYPLI